MARSRSNRSQDETRAKMEQYETFVDKRLKPDLVAAIGLRDKVLEQRKVYSDLAKNIKLLQEQKLTKLRTMINLGSEVYGQAEVPDATKIFVDIGLGFHAEFTLDEALEFIPAKDNLLSKQVEQHTAQVASIKNPCLSSDAHHCLLLALPAASLRPCIAAFLTSSNDLQRFRLPVASESSNPRTSPVAGVSEFLSGSRVYARQGIRVLSPSSFSVRVSMEASQDSKSEKEVPKVDPIVQYIVLRKDLVDTMKWPLGSVISQGCHAAVAAVWLFKDDPVTAEYCSSENLDHMHKVTLEVKGETQLSNLAKKLEAGGVAHKLWTEQPENYPTCLATKPYHKSEVASFFKSLKLCR